MAEGKMEISEGFGLGGSLVATDEDRLLSQQIGQLFKNGEYDKCVTSLNQQTGQKAKDVKLIHNRAVAEFYRSGQRGHEPLKRLLVDQYAKLYGDKVVDGLDYCCMIYNQAVILFHTKQYKAALDLLEKLLSYLDPIEDAMSQKIVLLLTDLYLQTYQPQRALDMLVILEKSYSSSSSSSRDKSSDRGSQEKDDDSEKGGRASSAEPHQPDSTRSIICQLRLCCHLMMKSNKLVKKELRSLSSCTEHQATSVIFYKARYEFFRGNHQKALRILNSHPCLSLPLSDGQFTTPGVWQLTLGTPGGLWQQSINAVMYYNNVALTYFYQRKPGLALFYTRKALEENGRAVKDSVDKKQQGMPLNRLRSSKHYELTYNLGVALLHSGQAQAGFDHLLQVIQVYHANPRLWLRLAECCIMCHRQSNEEDRRQQKKSRVVCGSVGSGVHHKIILGSGVTDSSSTSTGNEAAIPVATMEFASLCLDNAMLLLPDTTHGKANDTLLVPAAPGFPLKIEDVENLKCSVLAAKSYVSLYHNDHVMALQCAEQLLSQPRLSAAHRYLARLYAAEALVALDKISAGIEHLNPETPLYDISTTIPAANSPQGQSQQPPNTTTTDKQASPGDEPKGTTQLYPWSPCELRPARAILLYNLATAHAIRGEHDKALNFLAMSTQDAGQPLPAQMYQLKIFLELTEGRKSSAQSFIHDQFSNITSNGGRQ